MIVIPTGRSEWRQMSRLPLVARHDSVTKAPPAGGQPFRVVAARILHKIDLLVDKPWSEHQFLHKIVFPVDEP